MSGRRLMFAGAAVIGLLLSDSLVGAQPVASDDAAQRMLTLALDNIQRARCEGQPCAPATAAERANPPLTVAETKRIMARGALSGAAEHCRLDWRQKSFAPMMAYWRTTQKKTERQMALVALMHGIAQGQAEKALATTPLCTEQERRDLEARLPFRP